MNIKKILDEEEDKQKSIELDKIKKEEERKSELEENKKLMQKGIEEIFDTVKLKINNYILQLKDYPIEFNSPSKIHDDTFISWIILIVDKKEAEDTQELEVEFYISNYDKPKYKLITNNQNINFSQDLYLLSGKIKKLENKEFNDLDSLFENFIQVSKEILVKLKNHEVDKL